MKHPSVYFKPKFSKHRLNRITPNQLSVHFSKLDLLEVAEQCHENHPQTKPSDFQGDKPPAAPFSINAIKEKVL